MGEYYNRAEKLERELVQEWKLYVWIWKAY